MKRLLTTVAALGIGIVLLARLSGMNMTPAQAQAQVLPITTLQAASTPVPTSTPIPSATIGYEATVQVALATADEARRVNAMVTAEFEQRILEQLRMTQQAEVMYFQIQGWTMQAASTSIPLTATQQVINNTRVANDQSLASGELTATYQAPTQIAALLNAQTEARFAVVHEMVQIFGMVIMAIALLVLIVWFVRNPILEKPEAQEPAEQPDHMEIWLRDEKDPAKSEHYVFPCTDEQLNELAELVMNGERTFGYNRMERSSRTFRGQRDVLEKTRAVLEKARLATNTHAGESVINDRGVAFFEQWFETHQLPNGFDIEEMV